MVSVRSFAQPRAIPDGPDSSLAVVTRLAEFVVLKVCMRKDVEVF